MRQGTTYLQLVCSLCLWQSKGFCHGLHYIKQHWLRKGRLRLVSITYGATKSKVPQSVFILLDRPFRLLEQFVDCPKSARMTLALLPVVLSNTLSGLRSRCAILIPCKYWRARSIWYTIILDSSSVMVLCPFLSIYDMRSPPVIRSSIM